MTSSMPGDGNKAGQFRKKPIIVRAWRFDGSWESVEQIVADNCNTGWYNRNGGELEIETLEGTMIASAGDWIIQGYSDELYPCKPDIFEATYEPADSLT